MLLCTPHNQAAACISTVEQKATYPHWFKEKKSIEGYYRKILNSCSGNPQVTCLSSFILLPDLCYWPLLAWLSLRRLLSQLLRRAAAHASCWVAYACLTGGQRLMVQHHSHALVRPNTDARPTPGWRGQCCLTLGKRGEIPQRCSRTEMGMVEAAGEFRGTGKGHQGILYWEDKGPKRSTIAIWSMTCWQRAQAPPSACAGVSQGRPRQQAAPLLLLGCEEAAGGKYGHGWGLGGPFWYGCQGLGEEFGGTLGMHMPIPTAWWCFWEALTCFSSCGGGDSWHSSKRGAGGQDFLSSA